MCKIEITKNNLDLESWILLKCLCGYFLLLWGTSLKENNLFSLSLQFLEKNVSNFLILFLFQFFCHDTLSHAEHVSCEQTQLTQLCINKVGFQLDCQETSFSSPPFSPAPGSISECMQVKGYNQRDNLEATVICRKTGNHSLTSVFELFLLPNYGPCDTRHE